VLNKLLCALLVSLLLLPSAALAAPPEGPLIVPTDPNGAHACVEAGRLALTSAGILYVCTTPGSASSAVWTAASAKDQTVVVRASAFAPSAAADRGLNFLTGAGAAVSVANMAIIGFPISDSRPLALTGWVCRLTDNTGNDADTFPVKAWLCPDSATDLTSCTVADPFPDAGAANDALFTLLTGTTIPSTVTGSFETVAAAGTYDFLVVGLESSEVTDGGGAGGHSLDFVCFIKLVN
jgi:hypothetical protein